MSNCSCTANFEYLTCLQQRCESGCGECKNVADTFTQQCGLVMTRCGEDVEFGCTQKQATCEGKFHQASDGVVGLTLRPEHMSDDAYCGPSGRCLGTLELQADIHKPEPGLFFECAMPKFEGARNDVTDDWEHCRAPVKGATASCSMPMIDGLMGGETLQGQCWLKKDKCVATKTAFFTTTNHHARLPRVVSEPQQPEKQTKAKLEKSAAAHLVPATLGPLAAAALLAVAA